MGRQDQDNGDDDDVADDKELERTLDLLGYDPDKVLDDTDSGGTSA